MHFSLVLKQFATSPMVITDLGNAQAKTPTITIQFQLTKTLLPLVTVQQLTACLQRLCHQLMGKKFV